MSLRIAFFLVAKAYQVRLQKRLVDGRPIYTKATLTVIMSNSTSTKLAHVQILRALAVSAVVVFHVNPTLLPGGYLGVDIFFVISGFVITRSLIKEHKKITG